MGIVVVANDAGGVDVVDRTAGTGPLPEWRMSGTTERPESLRCRSWAASLAEITSHVSDAGFARTGDSLGTTQRLGAKVIRTGGRYHSPIIP